MEPLPTEKPVKLYEEGFGTDDLLKRKGIAENLSDWLEQIETPMVIALDGRWGTGKTWFLQRWVGAHCIDFKKRGLTVYFDAFAHDYQSEPLVGLVASLTKRAGGRSKEKIEKVKETATKFIKPLLRIGLAAATYGVSEAVDGVTRATLGAAGDEAKDSIDAFWEQEEGRQKAMQEFRGAIEALTKAEDGKEPIPLIFVVDELDRCRPDYALEVLEVIKHFFAVPHVHFVLGVNLDALENSVRARYGAGIDAGAYLRKFITRTRSLPDEIVDDTDAEVTVVPFARSLGEEMEIPKYFLDIVVEHIEAITRNGDSHISLRDTRRIMQAVRYLPDNALDDNLSFGKRCILIALFIAQIIRSDLLSELISSHTSYGAMSKYFKPPAQDFDINKLSIGSSNYSYETLSISIYDPWELVGMGAEGIKHRSENDEYIGLRLRKVFGRLESLDELETMPQKIFNDWLTTLHVPGEQETANPEDDQAG